MPIEIVKRLRRTMLIQILSRGVEGERHNSGLARDQGFLRGHHHAHRDICIATKKIDVLIGQTQLDTHAWIEAMKFSENGRQYFRADDIAGRYAYDAGDLLRTSRRSAN